MAAVGANLNVNQGAPGGFNWGNTGKTIWNTAFPGNAVMNPQSVGNVGGNQPHTNMQPYLVLNFCIALQGIFPSQT
jgi:microcystin-dependent protein